VNDERCGNCKFWNDLKKGSGECRKWAPEFHPQQTMKDMFGRFPETMEEEWCGEYQRKEEGE
jgi:hypothetical protein